MQASSIRSERRAVLTAIAIPLAILAVAYGMWWVSDRMLTIGPFDRATFGWTFVIPTWLAAPVVAGFVWRDAPTRVVAIAGAVIVAVLSVASSYLIWRATTPDCFFGAIASAADRFAAAAL
ncbi:MAG TPA: hypothetical protein VK194_05405, partial [Candidatus Deferrimicrobium sp.]|nr:hypothetical protein [Candidatus Deferrimicrobium sp.]